MSAQHDLARALYAVEFCGNPDPGLDWDEGLVRMPVVEQYLKYAELLIPWLAEHDRQVERAFAERLRVRFFETSPDFRGDPLPVALIQAELEPNVVRPGGES